VLVHEFTKVSQGARLRGPHRTGVSPEHLTDLLGGEPRDDAQLEHLLFGRSQLGKELANHGLIVVDHQVMIHRHRPIGFTPRKKPADVAVAMYPVEVAMVIDRDVSGDAEDPPVETGIGPLETLNRSDGSGHRLADRIFGVLQSDPANEEGSEARIDRSIERLPRRAVTVAGGADQTSWVRQLRVGRCGHDTIRTSLENHGCYKVLQRGRGQ
jgi:hypothetical protein